MAESSSGCEMQRDSCCSESTASHVRDSPRHQFRDQSLSVSHCQRCNSASHNHNAANSGLALQHLSQTGNNAVISGFVLDCMDRSLGMAFYVGATVMSWKGWMIHGLDSGLDCKMVAFQYLPLQVSRCAVWHNPQDGTLLDWTYFTNLEVFAYQKHIIRSLM